MTNKDFIHLDIVDAITDKPFAFEVNGKSFFFYPMSLGKQMILSRLYEQLELPEDGAINIEDLILLCSEKKSIICMILAYHTLYKKVDILDIKLVNKRSNFLEKNLSQTEIAKLLLYLIKDDRINQFLSHFGIDREQREQKRVLKVKMSESHSVTFGGRSPYGSLIDKACERYGWTFDYVVWGISLINLTMLLVDCPNTIYLSKEEEKKVHISKDRSFIDGDNPDNIERIKQIFKD